MKFLILCAAVMSSVVQAGFPNDWPKCHYDDDSCLIKAYQHVVKNYYAGVPAINLISFDPLRIKTLVLERGTANAVNIEIKLDNTEITGLKDMQISSVSGYTPDLSGRVTLEAIVPVMTIRGHSFLNGHILIVPLVGDGTLELRSENVRTKFAFDFKPIEKNGKTYASIDHIKMDLDPAHVTTRLENLFNGNQALTDSTNALLNENWRIIYDELKGSINKSIGLVLKSALNKFFEKQPYADYFL